MNTNMTTMVKPKININSGSSSQLDYNIKIIYLLIFIFSIFIFFIYIMIISLFSLGLFDYLYFIQLTHIFTSLQILFITFNLNYEYNTQQILMNYTHLVLDLLLTIIIFVFLILCNFESDTSYNDYNEPKFCFEGVVKQYIYLMISFCYLFFDILVISMIKDKTKINKKTLK